MSAGYFSVSEYYKSLFNQKVYKISLDAGCTCPTRDGTKGTKGCIFCSASGSGDFASSRKLAIKEQIEQAKLLVSKKLFMISLLYIVLNLYIFFIIYIFIVFILFDFSPSPSKYLKFSCKYSQKPL